MSRSVALVAGAQLTTLPVSGCATQRMVVSPAPQPACTGAPAPDDTIYDLDEVSSGPLFRSAPGLIYPRALREARVNGYATLAFVVNADGRVDSTTVTLVSATDSAFIAPARVTIVGAAYWPACRAGVPVRMQLSQRISFESKD